ncbi:MAG: hypothetical protein HY784_08845 [Chloroflexi bacterium]|nr:hypothetical protein [Chloroflexota bacterium]
MNPPIEWQHRQQLLDMLRAYRPAQVLITCAEVGVFAALADGPRAADDLAAALNTSPRGLSLLLNAAVGPGLLEKRGGGYTNAPMVAACLARPAAEVYLGNFVRREGAFLRRWSNLTQVCAV